MKTHFEQEILQLKRLITTQTAMVESAVRKTHHAMERHERTLAMEVIDGDDEIDETEVRIEEECLKVLALHQPVAGDLRYIVTLLKVNTELERIGDLGVNIAERVLHMLSLHADMKRLDITDMFLAVLQALKNSLDAFLGRDCFLAAQVIAADDSIDSQHRDNFHRILQMLKENAGEAETLLDFLNISRNLERIADSCTNIGEDVLYLEQGKIVRHCRGFN
ncbi:MAG: phosphate signaling complex protein PhoU [Planctomycetia bacterium]|nr:phosphate signaling complex protein PhoU [Planctomycetia bacterium]